MKKCVLLITTAFLIWNCETQKEDVKPALEKQTKHHVSVSILPQQYFVKRIAGDRFFIHVMIPPGHSPATFEPTPQEIKFLSLSDLYFRIGHIGFEQAWMKKISSLNKNMVIVDTSRGVSLISNESPHSHVELEANSDEHGSDKQTHEAEKGVDPHIWLSSSAVKIQAQNILKAFIRQDPDNSEIYKKNFLAFIQDIDLFENESKLALKPLAGKKFMVYHPAWAYFAREYGLVQFPIEIEGKSPGMASLKRIIDIATAEGIRVILVQQQFDSDSASAIAKEIKGKVVQLDPLNPEWLSNMKKITSIIKESFTL